MSSHAIQVVEVPSPRLHPNADRLEVFTIQHYTVVAAKGHYPEGSLAAFVPPDYVVPAHLVNSGTPGDDAPIRIKPVKLRGLRSEGILIAPPTGQVWTVGQDVMEQLGITRYEPPIQGGGNLDQVRGPCCPMRDHKFDVEPFNKWSDLLVPGELIRATEKVHGANARYCWAPDQEDQLRMHIGTRNNWLSPQSVNYWTRALRDASIVAWCQAHPMCILYGEVYGPVQDLRYGLSDVAFVAFAATDGVGGWMHPGPLHESLQEAVVPCPPQFYYGLYTTPEDLFSLAQKSSLLSKTEQIAEGMVIETWPALRTAPELGPLRLKIINPDYLEKT